ncbi:MAG: hypothetical protein QG673_1144 [Pseudomonadota bacterium]|nr:hypothetical protein [Pseudomonadota bacterium]
MSTLAMNHFNVLDYVEEAERLGVPNEVAKFQARQMGQLEHVYASNIDVIRKEIKEEIRDERKEIKEELLSKDFSTKQDVRESELRLQKEIEVVRKDIEVVRKDIGIELEGVRKEIAQSMNKVVLWVAGLLVATGLIQHFFK